MNALPKGKSAFNALDCYLYIYLYMFYHDFIICTLLYWYQAFREAVKNCNAYCWKRCHRRWWLAAPETAKDVSVVSLSIKQSRSSVRLFLLH